MAILKPKFKLPSFLFSSFRRKLSDIMVPLVTQLWYEVVPIFPEKMGSYHTCVTVEFNQNELKFLTLNVLRPKK